MGLIRKHTKNKQNRNPEQMLLSLTFLLLTGYSQQATGYILLGKKWKWMFFSSICRLTHCVYCFPHSSEPRCTFYFISHWNLFYCLIPNSGTTLSLQMKDICFLCPVVGWSVIASFSSESYPLFCILCILLHCLLLCACIKIGCSAAGPRFSASAFFCVSFNPADCMILKHILKYFTA